MDFSLGRQKVLTMALMTAIELVVMSANRWEVMSVSIRDLTSDQQSGPEWGLHLEAHHRIKNGWIGSID